MKYRTVKMPPGAESRNLSREVEAVRQRLAESGSGSVKLHSIGSAKTNGSKK
jgi:hypothetical protein